MIVIDAGCSDFFHETGEAFRSQTGSTLSFADAAIVTAARARANGWVATFDRGFQGLAGIRVAPG